MALPPWEESSSQLFVLVTGANSGLGYAICQRLINEFLTTNGPASNAHLIILLTTRSPQKAKTTISKLRQHLRHFAERSPTALAWSAAASRSERAADDARCEPYHWKRTVSRVHIFGLILDLCDLRGVRDVAKRLVDGEVMLGEGADGTGQGYRIPRLDVLVMNAGIGGWKGLNWWKATWDVLTDLVHATTYPDYKLADVGKRVQPQSAFRKGDARDGHGEKGEGEKEPALGEVFAANVFGHYMLGHWLMPLLSRPPRPLPSTSPLEPASRTNTEVLVSSTSHIPNATSAHDPSSDLKTSTSHANLRTDQAETSRADRPGRIIWVSSMEAIATTFTPNDIQGLASPVPYESSKRLTDLLALTATLPSVAPHSRSYFQTDPTPNDHEEEKAEEAPQPPQIYVTHPGICGTEIIPLPWIMVQAMTLAFYLARWLGSAWHAIQPYTGACAVVWVALMPEEVLAAAASGGPGTRCKWGSSTDRAGRARVKRTEVEGWGWTGDVGEVERAGPVVAAELRWGRRRGVVETGVEERVEFERVGAEVWREMERLRAVWEAVLGREG